jgi:peptide/nickel transport system permease protein
VIVETVFAWPGVGQYVVAAVFSRDYPVVTGFVVFAGTVFVVVNLAVDLLYTRMDPRVRFGRGGRSS